MNIMIKPILVYLLLLLSLVQFTTYFGGTSTVSFSWQGPFIGTCVLGVLCIVLMRQIFSAIRRTAATAGLSPATVMSPYNMLPWLFLVPWMINLHYTGGVRDFGSGVYKPTWEFTWGQDAGLSPWKIFPMIGLLIAVYLYKLKQKISELERKVLETKSMSGPAE